MGTLISFSAFIRRTIEKYDQRRCVILGRVLIKSPTVRHSRIDVRLTPRSGLMHGSKNVIGSLLRRPGAELAAPQPERSYLVGLLTANRLAAIAVFLPSAHRLNASSNVSHYTVA
jgi:hypothetical protein